MPSALGFIGGGLLEGFGKGLATQGLETGKDKRERARADLEHRRNLERDELKLAGENARPQSGPGKVAADIAANRLPEGFPLRSPKGPLVVNNIGPTGIDYGNPPTDMAWARDANGAVALRTDQETGFASPIAVPIAGGPVEKELEKEGEAGETKRQLELQKSDLVVEDINRVIAMTEGATVPVTGIGSFLSVIPGTLARDVDANLTTVKANVGFDRLQQMRESSPTGGALGAVSEREMDQLSSVMGALDQSQSEKEFLFNLRRLREMVLDIVHGPGNRPRFAKMTLDELTALDTSKMGEAGLRAASKRFQELSK